MAVYTSIYDGVNVDASVGRSYVPTLQSAPTGSTKTFSLNGNTVNFEAGQFARVAVTGGYDFYRLKNVSGNTATWEKTTYSVMGASGSGHAIGLVPDPGSTAGTTKFLREDGTWQVPSEDVSSKEDKMSIVNVTGTNTTYSPSINTLSTISMKTNLTVTLPTITTDTDKVQSLVLILSAYQGYTPNLTINGPYGSIVYVDPDFSIEAGKTYEINCMYFYGGAPCWAIAAKEIFWGGIG